MALLPLLGKKRYESESPSTIVIDIQKPFPLGDFDSRNEMAVVAEAVAKSGGEGAIQMVSPDLSTLAPSRLSFKNLSRRINLFYLSRR